MWIQVGYFLIAILLLSTSKITGQGECPCTAKWNEPHENPLLDSVPLDPVTCDVHLEIVPGKSPADPLIDLRCNYNLHEDGIIYSIKFYYNDREFYRYIPRDSAPVRTFPLRDFRVQRTESFHNWIRLSDLARDTKGFFKCEVSTEGPTFYTCSDETSLAGIVEPPVLSHVVGGKGDQVELKCRSPDPKLRGRFVWSVEGRIIQERDGHHLEDTLRIPTGSATVLVKCQFTSKGNYSGSAEMDVFKEGQNHMALKSGTKGIAGVDKAILLISLWQLMY